MAFRTAFPVVLALAALPLAASAELYKWIDEKGVVNYGDRPPANARQARALDESTARVSVVPGLPAETLQRERERALEARAAELERELQAARRSAAEREAQLEAAAEAAERAARDAEQPLVVLYPSIDAHRRHAVPPRVRPQPPHRVPRGAPVERTPPRAKTRPHAPAAMRADLPDRD